MCGEDNECSVPSGYVQQLDTQPLRWRYVQRARKRTATATGAATEAAGGALTEALVRATTGAAALVGRASGSVVTGATPLGDPSAETATETTDASVRQRDTQPLRLSYVQRARKRAATTTGEATVALAETTTEAAALVGSASGRVVTAAVETATATIEAAVGATAVLTGNDSAGAAAKVTLIAGQLGRLQAKNFKRRMNKLKVVSCPST